MVIITAANHLYFSGLMNLVGSIHYWAPEYQIVIFDLGLHYSDIKQIINWKQSVLIHNWLPKDLPPHCKKMHVYAWKPVIMHQAVSKYGSFLWIDAGSDFRGPIAQILEHLDRDGHFFVQGQDPDMTLMTHDDCFKAMGTHKDLFKHKPFFAGNLQGYQQGTAAHDKILTPLYDSALKPECIAPAGSNLSNHRFDQALLSIIIYQSGLAVKPYTELLAAQRSHFNPNPLNPSRAVVYTARCSSNDYFSHIRIKQYI